MDDFFGDPLGDASELAGAATQAGDAAIGSSITGLPITTPISAASANAAIANQNLQRMVMLGLIVYLVIHFTRK